MDHLSTVRTICVGNYIGLVMLVILFVENLWRLRRRGGENNSIMLMIVICMLSCFFDPISYYCDGVPGSFSRVMSYVANDVLFISYGIISSAWVYFMAIHLEGRISKRHLCFLLSIIGGIVLMVLTNPLHHMAFEISPEGAYVRKIGYYVNLLASAIIVTDGLLLYTRCRRKGGFMKSFPVAGYITPIAIAVIVQSNFYSISVISPSIAVGIASIITGLKNEHAYRDEQTGLFNRSYLKVFFDKIVKKHNVTGFMVQLNNLGEINREKGFQEGDRAIINSAKFLNDTVGDLGIVARFDSDKFIVLLNTQATTIVKVCEDEIKSNFERFNKKDNALNIVIHMSHTKLTPQNAELFLMLNELNRLLEKV